MPSASRPPAPRAAVRLSAEVDPTDPLTRLVLRACMDRARTPRYLAATLCANQMTVQALLDRLTAAGLVAAEAPSRIAGRMVTPYRTMPRATAALGRR